MVFETNFKAISVRIDTPAEPRVLVEMPKTVAFRLYGLIAASSTGKVRGTGLDDICNALGLALAGEDAEGFKLP